MRAHWASCAAHSPPARALPPCLRSRSETYEYYKLPYCKPKDGVRYKTLGMGEVGSDSVGVSGEERAGVTNEGGLARVQGTHRPECSAVGIPQFCQLLLCQLY